MTSHSELVARLEGASEGSRELDSRIWWATHPNMGADDGTPVICPAYTTSLDAALALAERMLPGWSYGLFGEISGGATATLTQPDVDLGGGVIASPGLMGLDEFEGEAPTPALAMCIAILRAKEPQPDGEKT